MLLWFIVINKHELEMGNCYCIRKRNSQKKIVLLLVGLDNAGKTTAAKGLTGEIVESTIPTVGFSAIKPKTQGCDVTIFDLGGGSQIRDIWSSYFSYVHGVIYVVDASDIARIGETKIIIENLLLNEKIAGKPLLFLANKQDKLNAMDEIDIVEVLELEPLVNQQKCHTLVKICSSVSSNSADKKKKKIDNQLLEGYRWLLNQILKDYEVLNGRVENDSKAELEKFEARRALQRKRFEELHNESLEANGLEMVNHEKTNGTATVIEDSSKNITSDIRDQLEQKSQQKTPFKKGRRSNKIHPKSCEDTTDINKQIFISSPNDSSETSMTIQALTSPLHNVGIHRSKHIRRTRENRPATSQSLGYEVGVWGLEREMDIVHPKQRSVHVSTDDQESEDDVVVHYLTKE